MTNISVLPKYDDLLQVTLESLSKRGGSASIDELNDAIMMAIGATPDQLDITYPKSGAPILPDRMSWARSHLKLGGLVTNPQRGIWVLTEEGRAAVQKSNSELKQLGSQRYNADAAARRFAQNSDDVADADELRLATADDRSEIWSDLALRHVHALDPSAFERLCQRLLRESGFIRVEVSGRSGDGGIDGAGVL